MKSLNLRSVLILLFLLTFVGLVQGDEMGIQFGQTIAGDDDYYFYLNKDIGTPGITEDRYISYLGPDRRVHFYHIANGNESAIGSEIEALYQIGNSVYVRSRRNYYELKDGNLVEIPKNGDISPTISLSDSISFSFYRGLQLNHSDGSQSSFGEDLRSALRHIHGVPQISVVGTHIYLIQKTSDESGTLVQLETETGEWEIVRDHVSAFALDEYGNIFVYSLDSDYTRMRHNHWPGDFILVDPITLEADTNLDLKGYEEGWEYVINSFACRDGIIIAYGGFFEIQDGIIKNKFKSVLEMSYTIE